MLPLTFPSPPPVPALFRWQWVVTLRRLYTQREGRMSPPWGLGNCRTPLSPFHLSSSSTSLPSFWSPPHQAPPRNHRDLVSTLSTIPTTSTCSPGVPALHPSHHWLPGSRRKWTLWIRRYPKLSGQGSQGGAMMGSGKGQAIKVQDVSLRSTTAWTLRANELCCYNGPYPGLTTHVGTPLRCARPWKAVPSAVRSLLASCHEAIASSSSPLHVAARRRWVRLASLWIHLRVRSFRKAFTLLWGWCHPHCQVGTLAWGGALPPVTPRTHLIWVEEEMGCPKKASRTPSYWLCLASLLRKQALSTEHLTYSFTHIHTHTHTHAHMTHDAPCVSVMVIVIVIIS